MDPLDLRPATRVTAALVAGVADDQLAGPTPCPDYTVADLLDHIGGLAVAFTMTAHKEPYDSAGGSGDGSRLERGWRDRITRALHDLGDAWRLPGALEGTAQAGPVHMAADEAALVALNEVVVHGWDLARSTAQCYVPDPEAVAACRSFVEAFDAPDDGGLFGPRVPLPDAAPELDRLLAATGRRPDWRP
ncbi:MAG TPA: TIGR03086 family metal-binding protein [Nocardioides sp.]|nr:TIGR03086 family metal-binding protein [Nocardioides sp.]